MNTNSTPKLTVCVVCYNQESYIEPCIRSIADQKTVFPFEVIVADDGSTDATRAILQRLQLEYPEILRLQMNATNLGALENYKFVHRIARGEYVAHVDGDDLVYPGKLQRQADFLDANPGYSLVAHRVDLWDGSAVVNVTVENPTEIPVEYLLMHHPLFLNSSTMYRKALVGAFAEQKVGVIDFYMYVFASLNGKIGFVNEVLGRYTVNVGISAKRNLMPYIESAINLASGRVDAALLARTRAKQFVSYGVAALGAGEVAEFKKWITQAHRTGGASRVATQIYHLRHFASPLRIVIAAYKKVRLLKYQVAKSMRGA